MTSLVHDSALQRLDSGLVEQERLWKRHMAAIGTSAELSSFSRLRIAREGVAARVTWLRWVDDDGYRGLNAGPFELLAEQARPRCRLEPAAEQRPVGRGCRTAQTSDSEVLLELHLRFAASANAAAEVRAALEVLSRHLSRDVLSDARLLVTELVTNSLCHSGVESEGSIGLTLHLTPDRLRIAVSDPGPGLRPNIVEPNPEHEGGRGLVIVDRVAACWGVGHASSGPPGPKSGTEAIVWFELVTGDHREVAA